MGSLPNLNELCTETFVQRTNAGLDAARERAQKLEFIGRDGKHPRAKDQHPLELQVNFLLYYFNLD